MRAATQEVILEGRLIVWKGKVVSASIPYQTIEYRGPMKGSPYVSDCFPLRLASHGKTRMEADLSMKNMIKAFLDELTRMGTLDAFLRERGWIKEKVGTATQADGGRSRRAMPGAVAWVPPHVINQIASVSMSK